MPDFGIKKCPFCNGTNVDVRIIAPERSYVVCNDTDCFSVGPVRADWQEAINVWNHVSDLVPDKEKEKPKVNRAPLSITKKKAKRKKRKKSKRRG